MTTIPTYPVFAEANQIMRGEVIGYRGNNAIVRLDTDEEALLLGSYPERGTTVRVQVESASATERYKGTRNIVVYEIQEPTPVATFWRAPVESHEPQLPSVSRVIATDGRTIRVEVRKRRRISAPELVA